ncbi:hypothetical protein ACFP1Z_27720 [Streptomyces gamaensis]|uniref:Uncharacterized protein n=1 Tax=Streptomyces gamaensis TaxID=1763542 RepID=A0ABW0ZC86_9ACTN
MTHSALAAPAGQYPSAVPDTGPFRTVSTGGLRGAVREFLYDPEHTPVPVPVTGRPDLEESVRRAAGLYSGVRRPAPLDYGVVLGEEQLLDGTVALARPFALQWLAEEELADGLWPRGRHPGTLLVLACYDRLDLDPLRALLLAGHRGRERALSVLSGRDAVSVAWTVAKQYALPAPDVTALGLFTGTDRPPRPSGVRVLDDRDIAGADLRAEILGTRWRRIALQGDGQVDRVGLGAFTVCGSGPAVPAPPGLPGPRRAYALPCGTPEDRLVPLDRVEAVEVVISSCGSGPPDGLALCDPTYQLLLGALDGPARTVVSAVCAHDAGRPENVAWIRAALTGADSVDTLNAALAADSYPYPAFMRFGMPGAPGRTPDAPRPREHRPDPLLLATGRRLAALLGSGLLPQQHALRPRLAELARKVDLWVARPAHPADRTPQEIRVALTTDLQSLDHAVAERIAVEPEDALVGYPVYFGDRSLPAPRARETVCHCGRPAQEFTRRGLLPTVLDTVCVVCPRCGEVGHRVPGGPQLLVQAVEEVERGGVLRVRAAVTAARPGPVRLGLFVPPALRADSVVEPVTTRVRASSERVRNVSFRIRLASRTALRAYCCTVFAVQDLAVSTARRHFGVVPRRT